MPCELHKNALVEAAVTGAEPQGELRAHLAACTSCRTAFAGEQSLFFSIDAILHSAANPEIPTSLFPRVRARIAEQATPKPAWTPSWLALAGVAAMILAFISVQAFRRSNLSHQPVESATQVTQPSPVVSPSQHNSVVAEGPRLGNSAQQPRATIPPNGVSQEFLATRNPAPEILVPRDQELLLARYSEQWSQRKRAPLVATNSEDSNLSPLQIAPIQIAQLDVKLLTEEHGQ